MRNLGQKMTGPPPGWYPDPAGTPQSRWWDGHQWSDHLQSIGLPQQSEGEAQEPIASASHRRKWRPSWLKWAVVVVAALLVAAGGIYLGASRKTSSTGLANAGNGSTKNTPSTLPPVGTGYLATGSNSVDFIQWNDNAGSLSGSAQEVTAQGSLPTVTTTSHTFEVFGTRNGPAISLNFDHGAQVFGTISGGSFTLDFPQPDGTLAPVTFQSASAEQYNNAVSSLSQRVAQANQTAAHAQALQQEEQKINSDAAAVEGDIANGLASEEGSLTQAVQQTLSQLQTESSDVAKTKAEEQIVAGEGGSSGQCYDAGAVNYDAGTVDYDAGTVTYDANGVEGGLSSVRGTIQQLQSDFATLQSDEASLPGYSPSGAPSQSDINSAISTANAAIASALSTTNGYIDQANGDVTTAYQYVAQVYQAAANCGSPPSTPAAQSHIS